MWYLGIFLARELKYFSFLIFLQFNLTNIHFLYSMCQAFPWSLVIKWWTTHVGIILLLTWLCRITLLPLVIHGKMTVFAGRIHVCTFGQFNTNLVNQRDIMRDFMKKKVCFSLISEKSKFWLRIFKNSFTHSFNIYWAPNV